MSEADRLVDDLLYKMSAPKPSIEDEERREYYKSLLTLHCDKQGNIYSIDGSDVNHPKMTDSHLINTVIYRYRNGAGNGDLTLYVREILSRGLLKDFLDKFKAD